LTEPQPAALTNHYDNCDKADNHFNRLKDFLLLDVYVVSANITFVLASRGHNAGMVSEPGHPHRHYRLATRTHDHAYVDPDGWLAATPVSEGSWWPAWASWLAAQLRQLGCKHPVQRCGCRLGRHLLLPNGRHALSGPFCRRLGARESLDCHGTLAFGSAGLCCRMMWAPGYHDDATCGLRFIKGR